MGVDATLLRLEGHITVSFFREGGRSYAQALQFDLMGSGLSREEAFAQLQGLLEDYVDAVGEALSEGHMVRFFNPSAETDWNRMDADIEDFGIAVKVPADHLREMSLPVRLQDLPGLRPQIDALRLEKLAGV